MVILLIPDVSLEITKALDYYLYVTSYTFSIVWSSFYTLNILRSNGIKGQITEELQVKHYWKSHTNLTHPGKYFRPSKVKIMRPTSPK